MAAQQQPSKVIKYALILEAIVTIVPAAIVYYKPSSLLSFLGASTDVPQTTLDLCQMLGVVTAGFSLIFGFAAADGPAAAPIRKFTYAAIVANEVVMCGSMLLMIASKSAGDAGGIPAKGLWLLFSQFAPLMLWRSFALVAKPQWFGGSVAHGKTA